MEGLFKGIKLTAMVGRIKAGEKGSDSRASLGGSSCDITKNDPAPGQLIKEG